LAKYILLRTDNQKHVATFIRVSQRILIKYKINCQSAQVKTLGVMVSAIGTPSFNTVSVYILLKQITFKLLLKIGKTGCACFVECKEVCFVSGLVSDTLMMVANMTETCW